MYLLRRLIFIQPIRILFFCCIYFSLIMKCGRPAICTLIGWFKSSRLFISLSGFCEKVTKWLSKFLSCYKSLVCIQVTDCYVEKASNLLHHYVMHWKLYLQYHNFMYLGELFVYPEIYEVEILSISTLSAFRKGAAQMLSKSCL